jgi:hypothetical protein
MNSSLNNRISRSRAPVVQVYIALVHTEQPCNIAISLSLCRLLQKRSNGRLAVVRLSQKFIGDQCFEGSSRL